MRVLSTLLLVVVLSACTEGTSLDSETTTFPSVATTVETTVTVSVETTNAPETTAAPTTTLPSTTVAVSGEMFVLGEDTLCDWFTTEEMDRILSEAIDASGTELEVASFESGFCYHEATRSLMAGPEWTVQRGDRTEVASVAVTIALSEDALGSLPHPDPAEFHGSALLDSAVTYGHRQNGLLYENGVQLEALVAGHTDVQPLWFGFAVTTYEQPTEDLAVAVLDGLLRGMGWTGTG